MKPTLADLFIVAAVFTGLAFVVMFAPGCSTPLQRATKVCREQFQEKEPPFCAEGNDDGARFKLCCTLPAPSPLPKREEHESP